jgi:hypothetical protein
MDYPKWNHDDNNFNMDGHWHCGEPMTICGQHPDGTDKFECSICDYKDHEEEKLEKEPKDFCPVGMSHCSSCGWTGKYPVSGCPQCRRSFCE